jgi:hypothetical protein
MNKKNSGKDSARFQRVSKARIFDGHPLQLSIQAVAIMAAFYIIITFIISLLFSFLHQTEYFLIFWSILPGAFLGFVLLVLERSLVQLKNYLLPQMGKLLTAFLLFFIHTIGYLALSSIIVSSPIGYLMAKTEGMTGMAGKYSLFSVNFFIVLALFSWWRNVRSGPKPCF